MDLLLDVNEVLTILERPDFELAPQTAGLDQVTKIVRTARSAFFILTSIKALFPRLGCYGLS